MPARVIVRNSGRVLSFALVAVLLFGAVYFGFSFVDTLITFVWSSVHIPVNAVVVAALIAYVPIVVQTYRHHPAAYMLPDATAELRGWLYCILVIDVVLGLVNYYPGILPGSD